MALSLIVALPTLTVSAESGIPDCVAPSATNGGGECHAPVIEETEEYPAVKHGGNYIYDVEDLETMTHTAGAMYPNGLGAQGNGETYIIQNDITIDASYGVSSGALSGFGGNFSNATINGMNTDGRVCTIHFDNAKCLFGWGRDVTVKNLIMDGYSIYDRGDYAQHIGPLYMHGIDYNCTLENITSRLDISLLAWADNAVDQRIGGVIAKLDGDLDDYLTNVVFEGSITVGTPENNVPLYGPIGGIVGSGTNYSEHTLYMKECHNRGNIIINGDSNGHSVSGIVGYVVSHVDFTNCSNSGNITLTADASHADIGGLIGYGGKLTPPAAGASASWSILNCHNTGNFQLLGQLRTFFNEETGQIEQEYVDVNYGTKEIPDIRREEAYITTVTMGGIVGAVASPDKTPSTIIISKCSNEGNIVNRYSTLVNIGGIIGDANRLHLTLEYCTNGNPSDTSKGNITSRNLIKVDDAGAHCGIGGIAGNLSNQGLATYVKVGTDPTKADYYQATLTQNNKKINVNNCINYGKISLSGEGKNLNGGGIIGRIHASPDVRLTRCLNYGEVDISQSSGWSGAAGIIGAFMTVAKPLWNPTYDGTVEAHDENGNVVKDKETGEVIKHKGRFDFGWSNHENATFVATYCYNMPQATVSGGIHAGGIIGAGQQLLDNDISLSFSYCTNEAAITGKHSAGGIAGALGEFRESAYEQFGKLDFNYCVNKGNITLATGITSSGYYAGGILAYTEGDSESEIKANISTVDRDNKANERTSFTNCANKGTITMSQTVNSRYYSNIAGYVTNYVILNNSNACGTLSPTNADVWIDYYPEWTQAGNDGGSTGSSKADSQFATAQAKTGIIRNEDDYIAAFISTNNATGAFYIVADITLTSKSVETNLQLNSGVIYGNGHTINFNGNNRMFNALMGAGCAVYDLNLTGTITTGNTHVSPLAWHGAQYPPILSNIHSSVIINYSGTGSCAGILSKIDSSSGSFIMEDCIFDGRINRTSAVSEDTYGSCGGLIGYAPCGGLIVDCQTSNNSSITLTGGSGNSTNRGVAGFVGFYTDDMEIRNSTNGASISISNGNNIYAGGMLGVGAHGETNAAPKVYIYNSHNTATSISGGQYVGGLVGGFPVQVTTGAMTIEMIGSTNKARVTGINAAGGLVGSTVKTDATITLSDKCANTGAVQATAGVAGGLVGEAQNVSFSNVANTGAVSGTTGAGGLVGNASTSATALNCVNRGNVEANNNAGGIISTVGGSLKVEKTANGGSVTSKSTTASPATAAGIVAYIGTATSATIDRCANSGAISVLATAASATDTAVTAAGILGISNSAAVVNNCINMGKIITGGSTSSNSAYPISNPTSGKVTTTAARTVGNVYRNGTVNAENAANYTLSSPATGPEIKAQLDVEQLWAFDMAALQEQRLYAIELRDVDNLYRGDSLTRLNTELSESNSVITADWTNPNNWIYQTNVNIAEDQLVAAMTPNNSTASYIVYIPAIINPGETETDITVKTDKFNPLSLFTLTFTSDLRLDNVDTPEDKLTYRIDINGNETPSGTEILRYEGRNPAQQEYKLKATITPIEGENVYVAGVYKDTVGFIINYNEVPKDSYTD